MKSFYKGFPFAAILAATGCSAVEAAEPEEAKSASSVTTEESQPARRVHVGGPDFLVFAALHENINLTAEQRSTIEKLAHQNRPDKTHAPALAAAVRAGKIEPMDTTPSAVSIETLHKTLTKEQRVALVDAMIAKRGDARRPPEHQAADGKVLHHQPLHEKMLEDIELTDAQKAAIKTNLEAARPKVDMKQAMDAKLQSFKNDDFDAKAFVTPPAGMTPHAELSAIVSVLDQTQREQLAKKIEQGPPVRVQMRPR